ncbi:TPA: AAA family ATPase [Campylobacter jejuni]|nr:AAA family ATPase [Campylobacter jejuni]EAJ7128319.1 restriction endonuclease [Campylobacter jejuni]EAK7100416.1 restriction endonuclease [Campylobacter jejuni]EAL4167752.1 restriction endonuclease [Campylobacter jejuni]ECO3523399.1 AAA domain-containing protein [Campylobacter jejuni]ECO3802378.1 AAA domain-containing protein [Campylobacter jejuni]
MTKIFSENNKKEIQDIFKKMIDLAMKFYNDRNSTFKDDIEDIQNFFESYEWKLYTGLQTLQKDEYKGFALYKEIEEEEYIKFKKGRSAWHGIYIWFGVSRDDIYMRIVTKEEEKCNALLKIQKDNILDYKLEEKIDKFEEIKDRLFDVFLYLSNYINNLSKDDFKIIKDYNMMKNNTPLNQILYGSPGTGKTYHTIDKALEILGENLESRDEKKAKFDEYVKNGQIVFTTFHQSYGYEEFVEGIKPSLNSDENSQINYKVKDGIFKELCKKALENRDDIESFNFYINDLKEKTKEDANNPEKYFQLPNTKYSIQYRGGKTFRIKFDDMSKNHKDYPVSIDNIEKLYKTSNIDEIYNSAYVKAILNYLKSQGLKDYKEKDEKINLPYIIIIDEINRGNVSKIFGELITLIEPSKRLGNEEALELTLPYSGEKFGVPKNVYIIGTMNTADRSITSLDTALRRRFEFVEMMPNSDLLNNVFICKDVENPNEDEDYLGDDAKTEGYAEILQNILISINKRIEFLLDREKTIGHAFFMSEAVKFNKNNWIKPDEYEEDWYVLSISKLKKVFQNKIIPLLQEYFYNDYALINAVLNDNGMIFEDKKDDKYLQKIKNLDSVNSERSIYNIASFDDKIWDKIEIYQAIYNDEIANKLKNENE